METDHSQDRTESGDGQGKGPEPVWTFRGYSMRPGEFNTAMVHLYRGEIQRANTWRNRLDTTTNWAIITAGAAISFALSDPTHHHGILLLNMGLVLIFLYIEARRYRYFELFSYRVRLIETDFFAAMLVPPFHPSPDWAETLASSLLRPKFPISDWEALGRRFRRNYFAIFGVLLLAWLFKNYTQDLSHMSPASSFGEFVQRAGIGPVPGEVIIALMSLLTISLIVLGIATLGMQEASGEVLEHRTVFQRLRFGRPRRPVPPIPSIKGVWQRPSARREEFMTMVISEKTNAVAEKLMQELGRGVTALHGEGMYTQKQREVLMCALTETEIEPLKRAVRSVDSEAFIMVLPAIEIAGRGFVPLTSEHA